MARRGAAKASGKSAIAAARPVHAKAPAGKTKAAGTNGSLQQRLAIAERECIALREELERTRARQRQLEETNAHVCNRIAWALDSLRDILDGKP